MSSIYKKKPTATKIAIEPFFNEEKNGIELPSKMRETKWGKVVAVGDRVYKVEKGNVVFYEGGPLAMEGKEGVDLIYIIDESQVAVRVYFPLK